MSYKFFDKQFLVMTDDKGIIGKNVFYSDNLCELITRVESYDSDMTGVVDNIFSDSFYPFLVSNSHWRLAYYDPNYECKVAYSQGKTIQFKTSYDKWEDVVGEPLWSEKCEYRVKPQTYYVHEADTDCYYSDTDNSVPTLYEGTAEECDAWIAGQMPKTRRMTNRELARWLAKGKGQKATINGNVVCYHCYKLDDELKEVDDCMIREWDNDEWHEPVVDL